MYLDRCFFTDSVMFQSSANTSVQINVHHKIVPYGVFNMKVNWKVLLVTLGFLSVLTGILEALAPPVSAVTTIDPYHSQSATGCSGGIRPGTQVLVDYLKSHFNNRSAGTYACRTIAGSNSYSLHAEGRAVDYFLDAFDARQRSIGNKIVDSLLKRRHGHAHTLARRLGVQEIIWNCRIWTSSRPNEGMRNYNSCSSSKTQNHQDHVHIGLAHEGAERRTSFFTAGALPQDLMAVKMNGGPTTEVHTLDGGTRHRTFLQHSGTELHPTSDTTFKFLYGDYDGDRVDDLWAVKYQGPRSTELHVYSGANGWRALAHIETGLHPTSVETFTFALGDRDLDGRLDLYAIKYQGGQGTTEVFAYSRVSDFKQAVLAQTTGLHPTSRATFDFGVGDRNDDGIDDLFAVKYQGGQGTTEVFVYDGARTSFPLLFASTTGLHPTSPDSFQFVFGDYNDDGTEDLVAVKYRGGQSTTEVFAFSGRNFQSIIQATPTQLHPVNRGFFAFALPAN